MIQNTSSAITTLKHLNGGASAANQLSLPGASDVVLNPGDGITLFYDTTNSLWKTSSKTSSASGGGGGGGSIAWIQAGGNSATDEIDPTTYQEVFAFEAGLSQEIYTIIKVPSTYVAGKQVKMRIGFYSPSTSNTVLFTAQSTLITKNSSAFTSTTNQRTTTNTAVTMSGASNKYNETELDLSDNAGAINSAAIGAGDFIKVRLYRATDSDTAIARVIPGATEVILSS